MKTLTVKRDLARQRLRSERWGWSVQVAAEFFGKTVGMAEKRRCPVW